MVHIQYMAMVWSQLAVRYYNLLNEESHLGHLPTKILLFYSRTVMDHIGKMSRVGNLLD